MARKAKSSRSTVSMPSDDRETVSIRKIKNGFLVERSGSKRGKYFRDEEFSATKPVLTAAPVKGGK